MIADDIRRFIMLHVPSVPYLEAMLLLRSAPQDHWDTARLARHLYLQPAAAGALLKQLHAAGVIAPVDAKPECFCFQPSSPGLVEIIDRLAEAHAKFLLDVTHLIHAKTSTKARRFADAFVWKKET